jgi:membrane fusion protein, multidrug efflux system
VAFPCPRRSAVAHARALTLAAAAAAAFAACRHGEEAPPPKPPTVRVVTVARSTLAARVPIAGVLAPLPGHDVKVGALVPGRVDQVFVSEGDAVKVGQPLAHVEAQPLRDRVTETDAQRVQAAAAADNARTRLARAEKLYQDGIASRQEVDDARAALVAAESAVKQARAVGGTAEVQLGRATLRAPIAGVVAAILVPAGQPVEGNGTPVIEIADTLKLDLRAPVPASRIGEIAVGQRAELNVDGVGVIAGSVFAIAPLVDTATNTVVVRVRVANDGGRLRGGMFARGALLGAPHDGVAIPRSALLPGDGGAASEVAIVGPDGAVAHRAVVLGAEAGDTVEVTRGVAPGDRVIVAGGYALPDGTKVEVAP